MNPADGVDVEQSEQLVDFFSKNHEMDHYAKTRAAAGGAHAPGAYKRIGIVGGGTAGFLTALALRARLPHLDVTLIESSHIPIIGVGEATTPGVVRFLHRFLKLDIVELYEKVRPTWKQGIKFDWGQPGDYHFQAPFDWGTNSIGMLGSLKYDGNINAQTIQAMMMERDVTPIIPIGEGNHISYLSSLPHAYHLDNVTFVRYLHEMAERAGVKHLDRTIADAALTADGKEIDHLITSEGEKLEFDLYVDCSGFRSLLLEQKLGSRYVPFSKSLYTDRALTFNVPHGGHLKPYTTAKSMNSGWSWIIPTESADHMGYVHCSAFCTPEEAEREARERFPTMTNPNSLVKFRTGRHEEVWKGNVIAIGNAYGFVEPLESTGILMICQTVEAFTKIFPETRHADSTRELFNKHMADRWDGLRWFLSIHYKFNHKFSTPFWTEVREKVDVSGCQALIDAYRERAPLLFRNTTTHRLLASAMEILYFGLEGFDTIMLGQKAPAKLFELTEPESAWRQRKEMSQQLCGLALPQAEALKVIHSHPEILREAVSNPAGWVMNGPEI